MYYVRQPMPEVEIGIDEKHTPNGTVIGAVHPDSPAEAAGLKANDLITAINGIRADSAVGWSSLMFHTWLKAQPGDKVVLTIQRPGQAQPLTITPVFRAAQGAGDTKDDGCLHCGTRDHGFLSDLLRGCGFYCSFPAHRGPQCMAAGAGVHYLDHRWADALRVFRRTERSGGVTAGLSDGHQQPPHRTFLLLLRRLSKTLAH